MIKEQTNSIDLQLTRNSRYKDIVSTGKEISVRLTNLARELSDASFRAEFNNEEAQKTIAEGMKGLIIGADEQLGFFRASKIAHKTAIRIIKIDQQHLAHTPLAASVAHLHLQFFQEYKRGPFFTLIFHLDIAGKNIATAMINWVDPSGRPVKGNVYM